MPFASDKQRGYLYAKKPKVAKKLAKKQKPKYDSAIQRMYGPS